MSVIKSYCATLLIFCWIQCSLQMKLKSKRESGSSDSQVELLTWGAPLPRKEFHLSSHAPDFSLSILLANDMKWTDPRLTRGTSGNFTIRAPPGQKISAVIQALNLRSSSNNKDCIDYFQFYDPKGARGSGQICGHLGKEEKALSPKGLKGSRVFQTNSELLQVSYRSGPGDPSYRAEKDDELSFHMVEVVFSAVKDCTASGAEQPLTPCGSGCISSFLLCDERINCGDPESFAADEYGCDNREGKQGFIVHETLLAMILAVVLFIVIVSGIAGYNQYSAYRRIRNIPH